MSIRKSLRNEHAKVPKVNTFDDYTCTICEEDWPCLVVGLLDAVDAATARANAAEQRATQMDTERAAWERWCEDAERRTTAAEAQVAVLGAALPDHERLRLLAAWLDATDRPGQGHEVQDDLRRWADAAEAALTADVRALVEQRQAERGIADAALALSDVEHRLGEMSFAVNPERHHEAAIAFRGARRNYREAIAALRAARTEANGRQNGGAA